MTQAQEKEFSYLEAIIPLDTWEGIVLFAALGTWTGVWLMIVIFCGGMVP